MALALSAMPVVIHADDWIGRIAGNAYITQLSIPGAHDAGTGYGFTGFYGTIAGPSMALTQDLTIEGMWDCGVRAFDLRPAMSSGELQIFHGVCQTKLSFASAINRLCDLLALFCRVKKYSPRPCVRDEGLSASVVPPKLRTKRHAAFPALTPQLRPAHHGRLSGWRWGPKRERLSPAFPFCKPCGTPLAQSLP